MVPQIKVIFRWIDIRSSLWVEWYNRHYLFGCHTRSLLGWHVRDKKRKQLNFPVGYKVVSLRQTGYWSPLTSYGLLWQSVMCVTWSYYEVCYRLAIHCLTRTLFTVPNTELLVLPRQLYYQHLDQILLLSWGIWCYFSYRDLEYNYILN